MVYAIGRTADTAGLNLEAAGLIANAKCVRGGMGWMHGFGLVFSLPVTYTRRTTDEPTIDHPPKNGKPTAASLWWTRRSAPMWSTFLR